jgi:hypothetical protein
MDPDSPYCDTPMDSPYLISLNSSEVVLLELPRPDPIPGYNLVLPSERSISPLSLDASSLIASHGSSAKPRTMTPSIASSDLDLCPVMGPSECLTLPYYVSQAAYKAFSRYLEVGQKKYAELTKVAEPSAIFGVPLRQSIGYANVAISLVDAEGKSYIYGYVPIVVAKCGVYLKEKGKRGHLLLGLL